MHPQSNPQHSAQPSMSTTRIAVLMTCHNRKDTTLACLRRLVNQQGAAGVTLKVYLVDAGSTDGTSEAIEQQYPDVFLIRRDSSLFWCAGTRVAFEEAMKEKYEYYLWLNDDTILFEDAIHTLMATAHQLREEEGKAGIVVGSTRNPTTGQCTYGGVTRRSEWRPLGYRLIQPSGKAQRCITMNGNCVLIAGDVVQCVGNLSKEYSHSLGDRDYGLRASAQGIPIWIAPTYVGECPRNPTAAWTDPDVPLRKRLESLRSPKGIPPREWLVYIKNHAGMYWPMYFIALYMRVLFPSLWRRLGR